RRCAATCGASSSPGGAPRCAARPLPRPRPRRSFLRLATTSAVPDTGGWFQDPPAPVPVRFSPARLARTSHPHVSLVRLARTSRPHVSPGRLAHSSRPHVSLAQRVGACEAGSNMRLATWNVNSVRARLERIVAWLQRNEPDVVLLQETKVEDA